MPGEPPQVSLVLAVYNGEDYIRDAVESVIAEQKPTIELVVIDDGSVDSTPEILREFEDRDRRVVVHRKESTTLASALNVGFGIARGALLARLDADDVDLPGRLQAQAEHMNANPDVVLLGGQALLIDDRGREFGTAHYPLEDAELREALRTTDPFVHSTVMMRREAFEAVGGYRTNLPHAEDLDLWLRIAEVGRIANLDRPLVKYRIHDRQTSLQSQVDQTIHVAATRISAQARLLGEPDPLDGATQIDEDFLLAHGVDRREITAAIVNSATWLGRTSGRAGYLETEAALFASAYERARSDSGSAALVASVHRSVSRRHAERGQRLRAKLKSAQARLVERSNGR
jgi:hypothetical protein